MKVTLLLAGEAVGIPKLGINFGIAAITVWMGNNGFTSATNDLGGVGYILLKTQPEDVGELDNAKQQLFSNLHNQIVTFDIKPSLFVKDGGHARISMTVGVQQGGVLSDQKIEFDADDCTGIAIVDKPLNFSVNMLQMETQLADLEDGTILSDEDVVAIVEAAPAPDDGSGVPV